MARKIKKAICPVCFELRDLTNHHVYVKRYYGANDHVLRICRNCHDCLEAILESKEIDRGGQLNDWEYKDIARRFVKGSAYV
jgi:RNase P subunit RPR2